MQGPQYDTYDLRLLRELQTDARLSLTELGRRVHLSPPAVAERVRKLEACGAITGYRATVNLQALGFGIRALVRVGRTDYTGMLKVIEELPEVVNAWNVTGEDSWVLEIAVTDVGHLDAVVSRMCSLSVTSTSIILKTVREHQVMMPPSSAHAPAAMVADTPAAKPPAATAVRLASSRSAVPAPPRSASSSEGTG